MYKCQFLLSLLSPKLSQVKDSPFGLLKSQSLCLLPGATGIWRPADNSESRRLSVSQSCLTEIPNTPISKSSSGQQVSENNRPLCGSITTLNACLVYTQNVPENSMLFGEKIAVCNACGKEMWPFLSITVHLFVCCQDVTPSSSTPGAPCVCGRGNQDTGIPQISPKSTALPEIRDCVEADLDDGPEYLAIGNLGKHKRRDSSSSTKSSEHKGTQGDAHTLLALPPPRRCSLSEAQRTTGRISKGHNRSLSDTGVTQKQKNGAYKQFFGTQALSKLTKSSETTNEATFISVKACLCRGL